MTEIEGVTAKQIGYAWALRETYILQNTEDCEQAREHYLHRKESNPGYKPINELERILFWYKSANVIIGAIKNKDNEIMTRPISLGYNNLDEIIDAVGKELHKEEKDDEEIQFYDKRSATFPVTPNCNQRFSEEICEELDGEGDYSSILAKVRLKENVISKPEKYILDGIKQNLDDMTLYVATNSNEGDDHHCTLISIDPGSALFTPLITEGAYHSQNLNIVLNGERETDEMIRICNSIVEILTKMKGQ